MGCGEYLKRTEMSASEGWGLEESQLEVGAAGTGVAGLASSERLKRELL